MIKFQKGDTVIVTIGKDKGRTAQIEAVDATRNVVLLPGINAKTNACLLFAIWAHKCNF